MNKKTAEHVVIVGGAILGSFCAWSLRDQGFSGQITVVEKDSSYRYCSTALSAACIRLQFATPLNIQMSLYGVEFLRDVKSRLGQDAEIDYVEDGYLILGSEKSVEQRRALIELQRAQGADIVELNPAEIANRYPMLDLDGVGIGAYGQSGEGWFDAYSLMTSARKAARASDVTYIEAEVNSFDTTSEGVTGVVLADGRTLDCDWCILATGAWSGGLIHNIGIELPVVPRKRTVFSFKSPVEGIGMPMIVDTSGFWLRPEGHEFIGGIYPDPTEDFDAHDDFEPHHHLLESEFWPALATRVPAMEEMRLLSSWAGHYEINTLDHNAVIGPHSDLKNLIFATGFSGHGVMHAPAAGRGVAEWITTGQYQSLDLSPLGWDRIANNRPLVESVVI
ncbi:NAD(P)/FAD-dependent oxidoreductase [Ruegeria atlantica]|uniref:NAD(P)/FAD-dependent oxidoreductase n=1 Tax=Ruegeria atlantica TaxID=81569 RepID=UPI00147B6552|nr:FAD-binding oxidoreductase [Ruegeria atlantica]